MLAVVMENTMANDKAPPSPREIDPRLFVGEHEIAEVTGMSVAWLRKDRRTLRLVPFMRIGDRIRYDLAHVRQALLALEQGGPKKPAKVRRPQGRDDG